MIRELLDRVDDNEKREMKVLQAVEIPREHWEYANNVAKYIGDGVWNTTPFNDGSEPQVDACTRHRNRELMLNKTWRPQLAIVSDDLPSFADGGSVLAQLHIPFVKKVVCCMAWTCYAVGQHEQSRRVKYSKL